jgi:transcriptional regulator with XRE-family HTH domain
MDNQFPIPSPRQIRAIRGWFDMTQAEFADKCGIGATTLVGYENGKRRATPPSLDMIARQVAKMGVTFDRAGALILPN